METPPSHSQESKDPGQHPISKHALTYARKFLGLPPRRKPFVNTQELAKIHEYFSAKLIATEACQDEEQAGRIAMAIIEADLQTAAQKLEMTYEQLYSYWKAIEGLGSKEPPNSLGRHGAFAALIGCPERMKRQLHHSD